MRDMVLVRSWGTSLDDVAHLEKAALTSLLLKKEALNVFVLQELSPVVECFDFDSECVCLSPHVADD